MTSRADNVRNMREQRRARGCNRLRMMSPLRARMGGFAGACKRPFATYPAKASNSGFPATRPAKTGHKPACATARGRSKSQAQRGNQIALHNGVGRHGDLVADAENQVLPRSQREAAENDARCEHHLVEAGVRAVRPILVIDLQFWPEILHEMVLESRVP